MDVIDYENIIKNIFNKNNENINSIYSNKNENIDNKITENFPKNFQLKK